MGDEKTLMGGDRGHLGLQELNANAIHLDVNNLHSTGRTVLVTNPRESGQLFVGRRIQNYTGTESTEEIHTSRSPRWGNGWDGERSA
ncbi:unnamed protein product [Allacma fusca]|uniref:Uncharacterized protein n=1 Tax=Allacma fusca TaxID=39272 RepID=A0A8J2NSX3_9HEXA|nr:unnamed protein product [Allacma fusca]